MDAKNGIHLFNCIRACIAYCVLALVFFANSAFACTKWQHNFGSSGLYDTPEAACLAAAYDGKSANLTQGSNGLYYCSASIKWGDGSIVVRQGNIASTQTTVGCSVCSSLKGIIATQSFADDGHIGAYNVSDNVYIKGLKTDPSLSLDSNSNGKTCTPNNNSNGLAAIGTCEIIYSFDMSAKASDGTYTLWGSSAKYTGEVCSSSELSNLPADQQVKTQVQPFLPPVPKGKCPGTVNGVDVLVDCITTTSSSTSSTSTTATSASGAASSSGSSTNTNVTCTGANSCTTTTTVTNSDGSKTSTSKTGTAQGTCKEQPGSAACALSGTGFSGSCSSGFKATSEDAVINAMAEEQYRRNCQLYSADTDQSSIYNQAANGTDSKSVDSLKKNGSTVNIPSSLDMSGFGWGRSCPADPVFMFPYGIVVTLPFSKICFLLQIMGYFGVALTLLVSVIWVSGLREGNS